MVYGENELNNIDRGQVGVPSFLEIIKLNNNNTPKSGDYPEASRPERREQTLGVENVSVLGAENVPMIKNTHV